MKKTLFRTLTVSLLVSVLAPEGRTQENTPDSAFAAISGVTLAGQEAESPDGAEPISRLRLWLPAHSRHLLPYLELAATTARTEDSCEEVLYARLNEYRTEHIEPAFTILCKADYKTTFNLVYPLAELAPDYVEPTAADGEGSPLVSDAAPLPDNLQSMRELLQLAPETTEKAEPDLARPAIIENTQKVATSEDTESLNADLQNATTNEEDFYLELEDLGLDRPRENSDPGPVIF